MVREEANRREIGLSLNLAPDVDLVQGDERMVKQVLMNLLANAVKFTPDGGRVSVTAIRNDDELQIAVRDTGIGIAPQEQARVFEAFYQVRAAAGATAGTGLGLPLVERYVELHGGKIWVESAVGHGSAFHFTIPLAAEHATPQHQNG